MSRPSFAVVLPARYGSTRFPGKPLADIAGRPLIEWVHRRASEIRGAEALVVATDDIRIAQCVRGFGGDVVMTDGDHATGTDRVAEVARGIDCDVIVNLQGDEPVFDPAMVEALVERLADDSIDMTTACHSIDTPADFENPHVVKVVTRADGTALYFSRAAIPEGAFEAGAVVPMRHVGVYAYRREVLLRLASLERTPLEMSEGLEQLRALENGMTISVLLTECMTIGVDVPGDVKSVAKVIGANYTE